MQVVDSVQYLIEQGFDHTAGHLHLGLLPALDSPVELDDVLKERVRRGGKGV